MRRTLAGCLAWAALVGVARGDLTPRLKASRREKDGQVRAFAPDGGSLAVWYRPGDGRFRPGEPDPTDRPATVEVWDLRAPPP